MSIFNSMIVWNFALNKTINLLYAEDRAQILKKVGVTFYYILLWIKVLERDFEQFVVNLAWHFLYILINFKMAAFINFEIVTSSNFENR